MQSVALVTVGGTADRSANLINKQDYNIQELFKVGSLCRLPASAKSGQVDRQGGYVSQLFLSNTFRRLLAERVPLLNVPDFFRHVPRSTHPDLEELRYNDVCLHLETTAGDLLVIFA